MLRNVINAAAGWTKDNPLVAIAGALVTVLSLVKSAPAAWDAGTQMLDVPQCLTYARVYAYSTGYFSQKGDKWVETKKGVDTYDFKMTHRDRGYIILLNLTPRAGYSKDMLVRLPVCGGAAQWTPQGTLKAPQRWTELYEVWRSA